MIFVALGTQKFPFNRLLRQLDHLLETGELKEDVFAQTGHSTYQPTHYPFQPFLQSAEFAERVRSADLLVTHSGDGAILDALRRRKKVVVVPRLARYKEHIDNHQVEIAKAFHSRGHIEGCWKIEELGPCIRRAREREMKPYDRKSDIEFLIENFLSGGTITRENLLD